MARVEMDCSQVSINCFGKIAEKLIMVCSSFHLIFPLWYSNSNFKFEQLFCFPFIQSELRYFSCDLFY